MLQYLSVRRGDRVVYGNGLENRRGVKATESSNLSLSAKKIDQIPVI